MYSIKGGWVRQAFALAPSSDLEGRKSRIRRSKEERKSLVESFIKKYRKSNNGSFPSLNFTHKEVGGSFYTVRDIFREIIQENRVLTSPKMNSEEHDHYQFMEHPLGSMVTEPQNDFLVSDRTHLETNKCPNQYGFESENFSSSSMQFYVPESLDVKIVNGLSKIGNKDEGHDTENHLLLYHCLDANVEETSNLSEQLPHPDAHEFKTEIFVLEENPVSDEAIIIKAVHIHDQDKSYINALTPVKFFDGMGTKRFNEEDQMVEKTEEFGERVCTESAVMEKLDREKEGAEEIEIFCATSSHVNSDVMVETFPLRPLSGRIHDIGTESDTFLEVAGIVKDMTKLIFVGSTSGGVNEKGENKLEDSTLELDDELRNKKMVLNLQDPFVECPKLSTPSESTELDVCDVKDLSYKENGAIKHMVSEESVATYRNSGPLLERINLKTWEMEQKKAFRLESNPLLEFVKSCIVAFVKFWSD